MVRALEQENHIQLLFEDSHQPGEPIHQWSTGCFVQRHIPPITSEALQTRLTKTQHSRLLRGRPLQKLHLLFTYPCGPRNLHFLYWGTTSIKRIESYSYDCTSREASEFEFPLGKERNWDVVSHILHLRSIHSSCDPSWVVNNSTIRHTLKDKKWTKVLTDLGDRKKRKGSRVSKDSLIH